MPKVWVAGLFKKFQARYGSKWISAIDGIEEVAVAEWSEGLAGLSPEQIKRGLDSWQGVWPPSLPEFRAACEGRQVGLNAHGLNYVPEYLRPQQAVIRDPALLLSSDEREARRALNLRRLAEARREVLGIKSEEAV